MVKINFRGKSENAMFLHFLRLSYMQKIRKFYRAVFRENIYRQTERQTETDPNLWVLRTLSLSRWTKNKLNTKDFEIKTSFRPKICKKLAENQENWLFLRYLYPLWGFRGGWEVMWRKFFFSKSAKFLPPGTCRVWGALWKFKVISIKPSKKFWVFQKSAWNIFLHYQIITAEYQKN